jgi:hypothetical protein
VNPKSADFPHAKNYLLHADVWQNPILICGFLWLKLALGADCRQNPHEPSDYPHI